MQVFNYSMQQNATASSKKDLHVCIWHIIEAYHINVQNIHRDHLNFRFYINKLTQCVKNYLTLRRPIEITF